MATSLAAIGITALAGAVDYALHGDVQPGLRGARRDSRRVRRAWAGRRSSSGCACGRSLLFAALLVGDRASGSASSGLLLAVAARPLRRRARRDCSGSAAGSSSCRSLLRARPHPAPRGGDLSARDPADRVAAGTWRQRLRQRPLAGRARDRLASVGGGKGASWRRLCRARRCGSSSPSARCAGQACGGASAVAACDCEVGRPLGAPDATCGSRVLSFAHGGSRRDLDPAR